MIRIVKSRVEHDRSEGRYMAAIFWNDGRIHFRIVVGEILQNTIDLLWFTGNLKSEK